MSYSKSRVFSILCVTATLCLWSFFGGDHVLGQTTSISTLGDEPGNLALFEQKGEKYEKFALVEVKGKIVMDASGIAKGADCFLRLQTVAKPNRWVKITKRELIKGRLVVTTEDGQVFTIYDLSGTNYTGKIHAK